MTGFEVQVQRDPSTSRHLSLNDRCLTGPFIPLPTPLNPVSAPLAAVPVFRAPWHPGPH